VAPVSAAQSAPVAPAQPPRVPERTSDGTTVGVIWKRKPPTERALALLYARDEGATYAQLAEPI
jgi:hypothetical protein